MKLLKRTVLVGSLLLGVVSWCADTPWQTARIVEVKTTTHSRTTAWVVNTPVVQEENVCLITVHYKNRIIKGSYLLGKEQAAAPLEWVKHTPVRMQLVGDTILLKAPAGEDYKLHLESSKPAPTMDPLTPDEVTAERAAAAQELEDTRSMIGFDEPREPAKPAQAPTPAPAPAPPPALPEPTTGTVAIRSTPYLADVYVDGEDVGYTPAKLKLAPGKHTFRCEKQGYKPWTKEITLPVGSELTLDATLDRK